MADWRSVAVAPEAALGDAITKINSSGLQVALIVGSDDRLVGILTDGNIRRAVLAGKNIQVSVSEVMNPHPTTVPAFTPSDEILALMHRASIHHVPQVDGGGRVVGLVTLDELTSPLDRPNWVVLMAGGLGTRLHPLTHDIPKPLLAVGGKPILETILERFVEQGFKRIFLSVNYKAEMIRSHFGAGDRWGVQVEYLHESTRLGTAGALSLLPDEPTDPIVVMNGDLVTRTNFGELLQFHLAHKAAATMAVREYDFQVPYGVVRLNGVRIEAIEEKPVQRFFVNAGIYALSPEVLSHLPSETFFNMTTLFESLIVAGKIPVAYPLRDYWLDIGRLEELDQAQQEWGADLRNRQSGDTQA